MFNLSSPEASAATLLLVLIGLNQFLKQKLGLVDLAAELLAFVVGAILGLAWYAAWNPVAVEFQPVFGLAVSLLAFALVPSGIYKFTMSVADRASGCNGQC